MSHTAKKMASTVSTNRLSALDALFVYIESNVAPMHVGWVCVYDGAIHLAEYRKHIAGKLHRIPRYRQRLAHAPLGLAHPAWEDDPDFALENHIQEISLNPPGTTTQLRNLSEKLFRDRLDSNRPLWEQWLVQGVGGKKTALLTKVHHCMVDGMSAVELIRVMLSPTANEKSERAHLFKPAPPTGGFYKVIDAIRDDINSVLESGRLTITQVGSLATGLRKNAAGEELGQMAHVAGEYLKPLDHLPFNVFKLDGNRKMGWCDFDLRQLSEASKTLGGTLNNVVLTIVVGAVRRYLKNKMENIEKHRLDVMVPVNIRSDDAKDKLGNQVSILPISISLEHDDPIERLREICAQSSACRSAHIPESLHIVTRLLQSAPPMVQEQLGKMLQQPLFTGALSWLTTFPLMNVVCTNVPGPQAPLYTLGQKCLSVHPYMPICLGMGSGFPCVSYNGRLYLSVVADTASVPDIQKLRRALELEHAALLRKVKAH